MNTHVNITTAPLVYKGVEIIAKGEMLSLTNMWNAAGADPSKQPAKWRELPSTKEFAGYIADVILQKSEDEIFAVTRGGKSPGTWAHWQVAMNYARYLEPSFAAWCNQVVRERMEGKALDTMQGLTKYDISIIGNVVKNCAGVALREQITEVLPQMVAGYIAERHLSIADGVTAGEVCDLSRVASKYPRGISARVSTQMSRFCAVRNISVPVTRLGRVRAQVFPTNAAREWLDLEGRALIRRWIEEKQGQKHLRLIGGRA